MIGDQLPSPSPSLSPVVMLVEARTIKLIPDPTSSSPPSISSVILDSASGAAAIMFSNSSLLLYPSLSPYSSHPCPAAVSSAATAVAFLHLSRSPSAACCVILIAAAPYASGFSVLRAWTISSRRFSPTALSYKHDRGRLALPLPVPHGISLSLCASVNVLVIHSSAANQIWILSVRDDAQGVELLKCAVIDCTLPIYALRVCSGLLLLGEVSGVRVFPLRLLIKGNRSTRHQKVVDQAWKKKSSTALAVDSLKLVEDAVGGSNEGTALGNNTLSHFTAGKLKTIKMRQISDDRGSFFIHIKHSDLHSIGNPTEALALQKVVSIHVLSRKKFLVLDSFGDLHVISFHNTALLAKANDSYCLASKNAGVSHLECTMKVQILAVIPDISARPQVVWISDGGYSVQMLSLHDIDPPAKGKDDDEKAVQVSVIQAIFTGEKVLDVIPLAASSILVVGQGNIFAYAAV